MQKTLRKPENWQDFESLAKKLWGELWEIPHKIKKNGRLGQPQNGVDVYGIPKSETSYWGVQCKGKNDYNQSKLTKQELDDEIVKAKSFSPKLAVFIIATTQSKDVEIEQYIREKDLESRNKGNFEIILFCWEDIVDLIEENRQTLNWYLGINNYREKYDVNICFENDDNEIVYNPKFLKKISRYRPLNPNLKIPNYTIGLPKFPMMFESNEVNKSWCTLGIKIKNTGTVVLEDWYLKLKLENPKKISDGFHVNIWMNETTRKMMHDNRTLFGYEEDNRFLYEPASKEPLIQKSGRNFKIHFIPHFDQEAMNISWEFLARDFDKSGNLVVKLEPEYKEEIFYVEGEWKDDKVEIKELIEVKK